MSKLRGISTGGIKMMMRFWLIKWLLEEDKKEEPKSLLLDVIETVISFITLVIFCRFLWAMIEMA